MATTWRGYRPVLAADDLVDPDRRVGGRAVRRSGVVLEDLEAFADADRAGTVLGVMDADVREAFVHGPLQAIRRILHVRLDEAEEFGQVESVGGLRHAVAGQRPPGAGDDRVGVGEPRGAKLLDVRVLLDDVVDEPVLHLGDARVAEHGVQLGRGVRPGAADQDRDETGRGVARLPELTGEVGLGPDALGHRPQPGEVDTVVVAVAFVHRTDPRILQRREICQHLADRGPGCRIDHHSGLLRFSARPRVQPTSITMTTLAVRARPGWASRR